MTAREVADRLISLPTAVVAGSAILLWLGSTAFVPRGTYAADRERQALVNDSLRGSVTGFNTDIAELKRIGCALLTDDQKKIAQACR